MSHSAPDTTATLPKAWPFEEAAKVAARVAQAGKGVALFETGYGPSGLPHIGTFGEVARTTWVRRAYEALTGQPTRLLAFSDDMDALRKVPDNVPNRDALLPYIGQPLTRVPDPFGTHDSFGAHNNARLRAFLDGFGFEYEFASAAEYYASGRFDAALVRAAEQHDAIVAAILPTLGAERQATYSPFLPLHPRTGRVMQVRIDRVDAHARTIEWQDPDTAERFETPITGGACKLQWKADWAMRWFALGVDYEMSGKDLIDSVKLSSKVCRILGAEPPVSLTYELFLDDQARKISKSRGNGLTIEDWLRYAPPESLGQFMYNQPQRAKRLVFDVIPRAVDDVLANAAKLRAQSADEQRANPAWHVLGAGSNVDVSAPVPFSMLLNLASVVNAETPDMLWGFLRRYSPDAAPGRNPFLDGLVRNAVHYYQDFVRPAKQYRDPASVRTRRLARPGRGPCRPAARRHPGGYPGRGVCGRQAPPVPEPQGVVRLPVPGPAGPAGRAAVRWICGIVRHHGDHDPDRSPDPRGCRLMLAFLKKALKQLPTLIGLILLVGSIYVIWKEFRNLKISDVKAALAAIPPRALLISFVWTVLSYWVLTFYDRLGTIYAGHKVSYGRVSFASFCAYSLSHNLGFAAVSGAAVRYRLYSHWGLTPFQIAKVVAFCSLTFTLGGLVLGGLILFVEPDAIPYFGARVPAWGMYVIGVALWMVVAVYVCLSRFVGTVRLFGQEITLPDWRMAIIQVTLATVDVAVTAAIVYELLPKAEGLTFLRFLGVYVASYTAGLAANVPGGLGVFDTALLLGLEPYLKPPEILGAIVVFRLYYYIIPLFLAGAMFAGNEILLRGNAMFKTAPTTARRAQALSRWSQPSFAVGASTGAVALCGALLLGLGVLDKPDFSWVDPDFMDAADRAGQFVPSLMGLALLVLSISLSHRVTLAWWGTIGMLVAAAAWTSVQGSPAWVPGVLALAALLVAPFRSAYYRKARLLAGPLQASTALPLAALVMCVLALALNEPRVRGMDDNSLFDVVLSPDLPNSVRITVLAAALLALVALWRLIRPGRVRAVPWSGEGRAHYASLGEVPPASADGMVWGESERAAMPFRRVGNVLLGLGDPGGAVSDQVSAVWNLSDLAHQEGLNPAVWRAGVGLLSVYEDLGLTAIPLGPDGLPVPEHDGDMPVVREYLCCVAERDLAQLLPLLPGLAPHKPLAAAAD